jgi:heat shock protein HtpX
MFFFVLQSSISKFPEGGFVCVNCLKTFLLIMFLAVVMLLVGNFVAGTEGLLVAFILAMLMNIVTYFFCDRIAISMTRSRPLSEDEAPEVYRALRELTEVAGMPMSRVYLMPTEQPNAFATGCSPRHAVVVVTGGLLDILDYAELKGVLGHELAHII